MIFITIFLKKIDAELLFTDTDSVTHEIKSENVYEEFFKWKDLFYFSNYSKHSKFFDETNKKSYWQNEIWIWWGYCNRICWIKMYSMKKIDGKEYNTAKGVSIATEFDKFKDVLFNEKIISHKMKRIQSKTHKLGTYENDKISLSCFDDERYVWDDGIYTLTYFHKDSIINCKEIKKDCDKKYSSKKIVIIEKNCYNWKGLW